MWRCVCGGSAYITSVFVCWTVRECVYVCVHSSVKHSCCHVGSWWDRCDWLSLPLPHPIMLICSGTNRRTPLGVLQAHSQSLVLQKIVLQSYLNRELPSFLLYPSFAVSFCNFFLFISLFFFTLTPPSRFPLRLTVQLQHFLYFFNNIFLSL